MTSSTLRPWQHAGVLDPLDVQVAEALGALAGETRAETLLAVAMASRQVRHGHVCLQLSDWLAAPPGALNPEAEGLVWPSAGAIRSALADSALVGRIPKADDAPESVRPMLWDGADRLYLQRYFAHERRVARRVRDLAGDVTASTPLDLALADALLPPGERDEQREAALGALGRRFSIITGGPGTGKTSTVVRLLALYLASALPRGGRPPRIALLAPTGKAAARLGESIAHAIDRLPIDEAVRDALPRKARTVHSALGLMPGRYAPRRDARHPLEADFVVVDEASMIDLSTMRRLLDAVPESASVVLLGDADQLASVEAGATLGDLCEAARQGAAPLAGGLFELHTSHRYAAGSGVGTLASLARQGDFAGALEVLRDPGLDDVRLCPVPEDGRLPTALLRQIRQRYAGLARHEAQTQLDTLAGFRVLCAHRRGPLGAEHVNREAARALHALDELEDGDDYHGRPVLVTENDPAQDLYNGDVAVVHRPARDRRLEAVLPAANGGLRRVALARLPSHESVYAMSVHKSQGSEFDEVAIVLPAQPSPVLSRELLYTAITRARRRLCIYASEPVLAATLRTRVQRASGLVEALG